MRFTLGDLFFGVINLFVLVIPGAFVLAGWVLFFDLPLWLHREAAFLSVDSAGGVLLLAASCYFVGHLVSLVGQHVDDLNYEKVTLDCPHLRPLARSIVADTFPSEVIEEKDVRRWSDVILRQKEDASYETVLQKSADRRFFRNMVVVILLWIVMLLAGQFQQFPRLGVQDFTVAASTLLIALILAWLRFTDQDEKYSRDVFESLIAANPFRPPETSESLEVRWFFPGRPGAAVLKAWGSFPKVADNDWRTDYYMRATGRALGIELLQGRLEIKRKAPARGKIRVGGFQELKIETWTKLTLPTRNTDGAPNVQARVNWLAISKKRCLQKFSWHAETSQPEAVAITDHVEGVGCQAEITRLRIGDETTPSWWTLGFEAFGPAPERRKALAETVSKIFKTLPSKLRKTLETHPPQSYPKWIADQDFG